MNNTNVALASGDAAGTQDLRATIVTELEAVLRERREATTEAEHRLGCVIPLVFHVEGKPICNMRSAWRSACKRAGVIGRQPHDLRRSCIRNFERANVSRSVAMRLVGHRTVAVYARYAITSPADLREGAAKLANLRITDARSPPKVVSLARSGTIVVAEAPSVSGG